MSNTNVIEKEDINQIQVIINKKLEGGSLEIIELDKNEVKQIDDTFDNIKDFRSLGEKITSPVDNIINETSKVIKSDLIMNTSNKLETVNYDIQKVYEKIVNEDGAILRFLKSIPLIGNIISYFMKKKYNMKEIKGQIENIFSGFDQSYESLNKSIYIQKNFLDSLEKNLGKINNYQKFIDKRLINLEEKYKNEIDKDQKGKYKVFIEQVEYFLQNIRILIGNLELARKRILTRLDSTIKLSLSMNNSRPIFKTIINVAILETSGQQALDASSKYMEAMGNALESISEDILEDKTEHKNVEDKNEDNSNNEDKLVENVKKLKNNFDEIEGYRKEIVKQTQEV
ncbi:hypothetical protein [Candidatus Vampirococcus lugosii]|uniref:Toxic anion resistance protein n=1 Tax=Candidatus Vampirococcus lugosii TaxID=2789015 RepID=A0ABS5QKU1_9BACT|nr:hypothetical protein [Candidatus Vampirococcus lugosii]MBS8121629.1 hypothetical protein [Candidatus Vampirococcus lugosii]